MNAPAQIGDNRPPSQIELTENVIGELSRFLSDVPVIQSHEDAKQAAELIKRAGIAAAELETERDKKVRPLNTTVATINATYKIIHNTDPKKPGRLDRILQQIKDRLTAHAQAEEARRAAEAEARRRAAEAAERAAREATERMREAIENAAAGEVGAGVVSAIAAASEAEASVAKAARAVAISEKDVPVRVSTGYGRAVAMRTVETLVIDNHISAIVSLWPSEKLRDAILSASRDYRKLHDKLPRGISIHVERKI